MLGYHHHQNPNHEFGETLQLIDYDYTNVHHDDISGQYTREPIALLSIMVHLFLTESGTDSQKEGSNVAEF